MPKMKTKSSTKGRFSKTGTGKFKFNAAFRRHMMSNKTQKMKRHARGSKIVDDGDVKILRVFMPYSR